MALIAGQSLPGSALTALTFTACAGGGDTVAYKRGKRQMLVFLKTSGSADVTIAAARTSMQVGRDVGALASLSYTHGANTMRIVPVTPAYVADTGLISVTYSGVSNLSMAVLEL